MELRVRNVNGALRAGLELFTRPGVVERVVRGTKTLEWGDPVITIYQKPTERVLFCPERDANPFFHLFEAVWMLAGRNDVKFVSTIVKHMASFSDDGDTINGAYGHRWRRHFEADQLHEVTRLLRHDPHTRRAVMQMWDVKDLFNRKSKDVPCNTNLYFKIRDEMLDMTICCRSNDMLWGAYGANAVHFSVLQEYVADKIGSNVGRMIQISDSLHVYTEGGSAKVWNKMSAAPSIPDWYSEGNVEAQSLGASTDDWDKDMWQFFNHFSGVPSVDHGKFRTLWWNEVFAPMWRAWVLRDETVLTDCIAEDWAEAGREWLNRRQTLEDT